MAAPVLRLTIENPDGTRNDVEVPAAAPVLVGRDATCDLVLQSPEVSRRHATLEWAGGHVRLTDTSANGTFMGEELVTRVSVLWDGGTPLRVGPYRVWLRLPAAPQAVNNVAAGVIAAPQAVHAAQAVPVAVAPLAQPTAAQVARPVAPPRRRTSATPPGPAHVGESAPVPSPVAQPAAGSRAVSAVQVPVEVRRRIHRMLLDHLDLASLDRKKMDDRVMRPKVNQALRRICQQIATDLPRGTDVERLIEEMSDEALGLGPLEQLLADDTVSEIMVVDPATIYVEREGRMQTTDLRFTDDEAVRAVIERIVTPLGRRIDESTPLVDARLRDGSRVNAIIRPLAIKGPCITIRKFAKVPLRLSDLVRYGSLTERMGRFLTRSVVCRRNIVISGGTGSGKTTLLNVLSAAIPEAERIVTIEDSAELRLEQSHVVSLEARPSNMEGKGEITIRDLVRNALRMRPDRIIVGECRSGEALDMLQAMNTGHDGSMTTTHANSPREALGRLETLSLMAGLDLPARAIREQIAGSIHLIVQISRLADGTRKVTSVSEVAGLNERGEFEVRDLFVFRRTGTGEGGLVLGEYRATGYLPSYLDLFIKYGLVTDGEYI